MIIQCDSCQTKFKLNESAIKGAGVKVRCTKCQAVFVVTRPEVSAPSEAPPVNTNMEQSEQGGLTDEDLGLGSSAADEPAPSKDEDEFDWSPGSDGLEKPVAEEGAGGVSADEPQEAPGEEPVEDEGEGDADWGLGDDAEEELSAEEAAGGVSVDEPQEAPGEEPVEDEGEGDLGLGDDSEEKSVAEEGAGGVSADEPQEASGEEPVEDNNVVDWGLDTSGAEEPVAEEAEGGISAEEPAEAPGESEEEAPLEEKTVDEAVDEADWGLDGGEEEEVTDEAIDEADWGLGDENEPENDDDDIDDDEDWGLGEDDEAVGSVEDYTSRLDTELGVKAEEGGGEDEPAPDVETKAGFDKNDDVNKVLSDNDFALGDRNPDNKEAVAEEPSIISSEEEAAPEETVSEEEAPPEEAPPVTVSAEEAALAMEKPAAKKGKLGVILPILFIIIGIAILYFAGLFQSLLGPSGPMEKTLEITGLRGAFVQNEDVGKLYTLQGRIKNISDESQEVLGVKVTIFDKAGLALTSKTVSLARLVSNDELKTLSGEEIDRHYQDLSNGSIPPHGATPLMVVFSNLPEGMDELEVEVVR